MQSGVAMSAAEAQRLSGMIVRSGTWAGLSCHELVYEPATRLTAHEHETAFFALSLCGGYEETTGGVTYEYGPGSALFHGAGEEHAVRIGGEAVRCFVVEVDGAAVEERFGCTVPASTPRPAGEAPAILSAMYREFRVGDASAALSLQGLLLQLIATVSRDGEHERFGRPAFIDHLEHFLRANFQSQLTLDQIASSLGVPAARLSAAFRRSCGLSIAEEQRRLRIEFACRRMLDPSLTLAEIALESGFADQPHFSRAFRRVKGVTPARYRATVR